MKNKKVIKKNIFVLFLIVTLGVTLGIKSAFASEIPDEEKWTDYENYTVIDHDTTWSGHLVFNNPYKPVVVVNGATLTIEKGARIEILQLEVYMGRVVAEGDANNNIVFTKAVPDYSGYPDIKPDCIEDVRGEILFDELSWIYGYGTESSIFRYVTFGNMGSFDYFDEEECSCPECGAFNKIKDIFFSTALAQSWPDRVNPILNFKSGRLQIENSVFENNSYIDIKAETGYWEGELKSKLEVVNSNFSGNKQGIAVESDAYYYNGSYENKVRVNDMVILKNNWYGSLSGPRVAPSYAGDGEMVRGDYTLSGWKSLDLIVDPVIVMPGITGSMPSKIVAGKLALDPILHTYDNLLASLKKNGYEEGKNLFDFPYEWRNSNIITADELKDKISDIKSETGISKVDIVAHSMGGLLARQYIENANYQNDIDQLITLGTPHKGAPEAYQKWEAAEGFEDPFDKIAKLIFSLEAHALGYDNLREYIQSRVISVKELLPDYDYLEKAFDGEMKDYPDGYPRNEFLENLNSQSKLAKLSDIDFTNVIGKTDAESTINKYRVANSSVSGSWEHGMPENFYDYATDRGIRYGDGDETVPFVSTDGITANKKIEIDSDHGDLPTKAQCYVFKELSGKDSCAYISTFSRVKDVLTFGVFSPIDIQVVAPDGNREGKDFETGGEYDEISGAYYSGYDTDSEFLTIPNPLDGEYKILTEGTGDGEYKIKTAKISEDENNPGKAIESSVEIAGMATAGSQEELAVKIAGNEVMAGEKDKTPPAINIISPENKTYRNSKLLEIKYDLADDVSMSNKIKTEIFYDGNAISADKIDLSLEKLGAHVVSIKAIDEAGNVGENEVKFLVDADVDSIISNVNHYFNLRLITNIGTRNYLRAKLQIIKGKMQVINELEKLKMPKKTKEKSLEVFKKIVNIEINVLINQIQKEKNLTKTIDQKVRNLLIENLRHIRL